MKKLLFTLAILLLLTLSAWGDDIRKGGINLGMSPSPSGGGVSYRLNDSFSTDVAAGSVNGTAAVPGPGTRTVVDGAGAGTTSISSGYLVIAGENGLGDPNLSYSQTFARVPGLLFITKLSETGFGYTFGSSTGTGGQYATSNNIAAWANILFSGELSTQIVIHSTAIATVYYLAISHRSTGAYILRKTATGLWYLEYIDPRSSATNIRPWADFYTNGQSVSFDFIRIPYLLWTPKPISADSFTGALIDSNNFSSSLGNLTGATWSVSGGVAFNAPTLSAEIIPDPGLEGTYTGGLCTGLAQNGGTATQSADVHGGSKAQQWAADAGNEEISYSYTPTSGNWYRLSGWAKKASGPSGSILLGVGQNGVLTYNTLDPEASYGQVIASEKAAGTLALKVFAYSTGAGPWSTVVVDDFSIKSLTLNSLFATESTSYSDVTVKADVTLNDTIAVQAGVVACLDSATNPQTFLICYFDRSSGKVMLDQCVSGTYTNLLAASASYGAGRTLELDKNGTNVTVFYNSTFVGKATCTANTNTRHGLFSTGNGASEASLDNFELRSSGMITDGGGLTGLEAGGSGLTWGGFLSGTGTTGAGVTWDHEWNFSNSLNDNPAAGKTAVNLTKAAGTTTYTTDWANRSNDALLFDNNTYFTATAGNDVGNLTGTYTYIIEFMLDSLGGGTELIVLGDTNSAATTSWNHYIDASGYLVFQVSDGATYGTVFSSQISAGKHYQLVVSSTSGTPLIYLNGVYMGTGTTRVPCDGSAFNLNLGGLSGPTYTINNNGKVSRVATLKGTALTAAQVKAEYEKWVATSDANVYARMYGGPDPGANGLTNQSGAVTEGTWGSETAGQFSYQAYALRYSTTAGNPGSFDNTTNLLRRTGTWSIAGGKAVNAPVAGAQFITNGTCELDSNWVNYSGAPNTNERSATDKYSGTYSRHIIVDAGTSRGAQNDPAYTRSPWTRISAWVKSITGDLIRCQVVSNAGSQSVQIGAYITHGTGWVNRTAVIHDTSAGAVGSLAIWDVSGTGSEFYFDDISETALPLNQLITAINHTGTPDVYASVNPTIATGFQAGLALNIDDPNNPTNFNLIYYNQNDAKVYAERCVNGVYANIFASSSQTYSANKPLVARRIGEGSNNLYVWYNNVYVGVGTATPNGTWHGMFQTGASSAETNLDDWFCYGSGTNGEYSILNAFTN